MEDNHTKFDSRVSLLGEKDRQRLFQEYHQMWMWNILGLHNRYQSFKDHYEDFFAAYPNVKGLCPTQNLYAHL